MGGHRARRQIVLGVFAVCAAAAGARADTLTLKNGTVSEGSVVSEDDKSVTFRSDGMSWTFSKDKVASLQRGTTAPPRDAGPAEAESASDHSGPSAAEWRAQLRWRPMCSMNGGSFAIRNGELWAWGEYSPRPDVRGEEAKLRKRIAERVDRRSDWVSVSCAEFGGCALNKGGEVWCYGYKLQGLVPPREAPKPSRHPKPGRPPPAARSIENDELIRVLPGHTWRYFTVVREEECGIDDKGGLWCMGGRADVFTPPLGNGTAFGSTELVHIAAGRAFSTVSLGSGTACAVARDGTLWCWGENDNGQLGEGTFQRELEPIEVPGDHPWLTASAGGGYVCGIQKDGTLWCWGANGNGQCGTSPERDKESQITRPTRVGTQHDWTTVSAGVRAACATRANGTLWCWGDNQAGECGAGDTQEVHTTPTQVKGNDRFKSVAQGFYSACATTLSGEFWCWGANGGSQLGQNVSGVQLGKSTEPVKVHELETE